MTKETVKDVFEKVGLLTKAQECLESAKQIYHEHFSDEIAKDDKYKHISTEINEIQEMLMKELKTFAGKVEDLSIFKESKKAVKAKEAATEEK